MGLVRWRKVRIELKAGNDLDECLVKINSPDPMENMYQRRYDISWKLSELSIYSSHSLVVLGILVYALTQANFL